MYIFVIRKKIDKLFTKIFSIFNNQKNHLLEVKFKLIRTLSLSLLTLFLIF